ncbi:class I SAM-dependent methyltransferase [Arthrobacter sp. ATA002]|uniref:class I SAM-dependent methyltransferase n=1 Tax=Arthrobacter sp. ATA002 TaxID=2991715 RepID=UPI0022A74C3F|nr:class I SAM-dependent methyltransferase [Arthrobacter sp. ATA002]WAP50606.1 class I SAM-dependent methyltransferase [Arthrobacter sp. ATA002]
MSKDQVLGAYASRAGEYSEALGSLSAMNRNDVDFIAQWAHEIQGPALDIGCGPGHWTKFLHEHGLQIEGIDMVEQFVDIAAGKFPEIMFRVGMLEAIPVQDSSLGAILAWYSIIHTPPRDFGAVLSEFARCIRPGGSLLLGFFEGERVERFDHAVVAAYYWPVPEMHYKLSAAGFDVVRTDRRSDPEHRPHAAVIARRRDDHSSS